MMPDINNIKAISDLLDISIDYLLDDGSSLDLNVTRERIDLSAYSCRFSLASGVES